MKFNQPTTCMDLNDESMGLSGAIKSSDLLEDLNRAYAQLGKAFYEYRFEEPTPELLLYFDQITQILDALKQSPSQKRDPVKKADTLQPFSRTSSPSSSINIKDLSKNGNHKFSSMENESFKNSVQEKAMNTVQSQPNTFIMFESSLSTFNQPKNHKKEFPSLEKKKDRISSFDDLPNLKKKNNNFRSTSKSTAASSLYCLTCGNPISLGDDYCVNCGSRIN